MTISDSYHTNLVPLPLTLKETGDYFTLDQRTKIVINSDDELLRQAGEYLRERIKAANGILLDLIKSGTRLPADRQILLTLSGDQKSYGDEGYGLVVNNCAVKIEAVKAAGVFYGIQTLLQLFPVNAKKSRSIRIPTVEIKDRPRYCWRGMHLDVSRHFFPKEYIKKYIDLIAMHKMNTFHWHLTDDQGWRIEIRRYPKLTENGAWRTDQKGNRYGGFYTQEDIREVVAYAHKRFVTVVPEIELPGHARAALAAYPEFSCTGGPFTVATEWGVFKDVYCPGKEETFEFLTNILSEVIKLFPGPYIHIGGDECPRERWRQCGHCQARMAREGLVNEDELQSYFIKRIGRFLSANKKKLVGWDEILAGGLPAEATVMSWRGIDNGIAAAKANHNVVMTPTTHCYFDYYQAKGNEPEAIGGFLPLEVVYSFEPTPESLAREAATHILGAQGNVWTEFMPSFKHVEYMALPRMCALAEVLWLPSKLRDLTDFKKRLRYHSARLDNWKKLH